MLSKNLIRKSINNNGFIVLIKNYSNCNFINTKFNQCNGVGKSRNYACTSNNYDKVNVDIESNINSNDIELSH